jgi:hypothetical protein
LGSGRVCVAWGYSFPQRQSEAMTHQYDRTSSGYRIKPGFRGSAAGLDLLHHGAIFSGGLAGKNKVVSFTLGKRRELLPWTNKTMAEKPDGGFSGLFPSE